MAHRCVDRHFWSPAYGQYCTVLAMVLGGLNTHFFRIGKLSAPRPIRLAQKADDLFILWRRDPHRLDRPANITSKVSGRIGDDEGTKFRCYEEPQPLTETQHFTAIRFSFLG
jgi:hypothetical protein